MRKTQTSNLRKPLRQTVQTSDFLQIVDIFHLPYRCIYRFVNVCGFTVYFSVDIISHLPHDPDILQIHQGNVCLHDVQHINDLSAFFDVYNVVVLSLYDLCVRPEAADQLLKLRGPLH